MLRDVAREAKADGKKFTRGFQTIQVDNQWFEWDVLRDCLIPCPDDTVGNKTQQKKARGSGNGAGKVSNLLNNLGLFHSGTRMDQGI